MLCIVACEDITEVACWNNYIYLVAKLDLAVSNKLSVCRYIVDYLWCKSAPVEENIMPFSASLSAVSLLVKIVLTPV